MHYQTSVQCLFWSAVTYFPSPLVCGALETHFYLIIDTHW